MTGKTTTPEARIAVAFSYLFPPLGLVFVFTKLRRDYFLRYHGSQGLAWGIFLLIFWLALQLVVFLTGIIPLLGKIVALLAKVVFFGFFLASVYFFYLTLQGERFKIPLVYDILGPK